YTQGYNASSTTVAGGYGIQVHHNNFMRTLPPGTPSSWGTYFAPNGLMSSTGYINTSISDANLQGTGISISGEIHGGSISGNYFAPGVYGVFLAIQGNAVPQTMEELDISNNNFYDVESGAFNTDANTTAQYVDIRLEDNWIDVDPFFKVTDHNADGTWTNSGIVAGIGLTS